MSDELLDRADLINAELDGLAGDCDLEDDDPAGGAVDDIGEVEDWRPEGFVLPKPVYGEDQSLGPINEREVDRTYRRYLMGEIA